MASSNAKRNKRHTSSNLAAYKYQLYEINHVLRIRPIPESEDQLGFIKIDRNLPSFLDSCFQETATRCLLVLHCSNGSILMRLQEVGSEAIIKQFDWFQNPSKCILSFAIDPVHVAWVVVACADMSLYLLPALAQLKPNSTIINACPTWSLNNLTKIEVSKQAGRISSIVWWHTLDDRNICIIGTEHGEIIFIDLAMKQQVHFVSMREKIAKLELMQDLCEHTTQLYIHTAADGTWLLLLEWPSPINEIASPASYSSAFDMGFDMVSECGMDIILAHTNEVAKDELQISKCKVPSQDCSLSVQKFKEQVFIARYFTKSQTLEIFSDYERSLEYRPEYSFQLPQTTRNILITDNLIFCLTQKDNKPFFSVIAKRFAGAPSSMQPYKKSEYRAEVQCFPLFQSESVLAVYSSSFERPSQWNTLFPHSRGMKDQVSMPLCTIVTDGGIMECQPRISPEHYFTELCRSTENGAAEALGITLNLNVQYLYEVRFVSLIKKTYRERFMRRTVLMKLNFLHS